MVVIIFKLMGKYSSLQPLSGLHGNHAVCLPVHIVIMQHVSSCRGVMIGQGNEPQWEQGGAQSGRAETCLPSGTERQTFVWLWDSLMYLHLTLTSLSLSGSPLSPPHFCPRQSLTLPLLPQLWPSLSPSVSLRHLHLSSLLSCLLL